jgi:hypothetical protein
VETDPTPAAEQEFEYLRVEVTRTSTTDLFLKVPKGWRPSGRDSKILGRAAKETTDDSDWDSWRWEDTVEAQGHAVVDADEAELYAVYDAVADLAKRAAPTEQ